MDAYLEEIEKTILNYHIIALANYKQENGKLVRKYDRNSMRAIKYLERMRDRHIKSKETT